MEGRRFAGKVALVTGAGRGIGRAIALAFAREGAAVAINYMATREGAERTAEEARRLGVPALAVPADVSLASDVTAMIAQVEREWGRIDILVNNAAVFSPAPLFEVTEALWDRIQGINMKGVFLCSQAAARGMVQRGSGVIINLASGGGLSPDPGYDVSVAYASSKAGVLMLTKRLALELAPAVRVNAVAPGMIDSKPEQMSDAFRARFAAQTPLRRLGWPEEIAAAVLFLASDEAAFITGQTLNVDGGIITH
ncbi:MAG: 3-oxoacyl-ACP reductase FabG [Chloroflexi bacterium]|nr:3-oxoacyl-ACP reductase FabG [Chloroflexota bacterium]